MSQLVAQYEYLSSLMYSLEKENANNSNTDLLQVRQCIALENSAWENIVSAFMVTAF